MFASPMGTGETRYMAYRCRTPHLTRRLDLVDELVSMAVVARLSQPDAAALFTPDVDLDGLRTEATELRTRRDELAALLPEGLLSAAAVRKQAAALRGRLETIEGTLTAACGSSPAAAGLHGRRAENVGGAGRQRAAAGGGRVDDGYAAARR